MIKFDIQFFAVTTPTSPNLPGAVVGHRLFITEKPLTPGTLPTPVIGVRATPDLGSAQNTVEANAISDVNERSVLGLFPASDLEYTYWLTPYLVEYLSQFIGQTVWIYEEIENMTSTPEKLGTGMTYQVQFGGMTSTGQSPESLLEMTQTAVLKSDEYYMAIVDNSGDVANISYVGMQTGKRRTSLED